MKFVALIPVTLLALSALGGCVVAPPVVRPVVRPVYVVPAGVVYVEPTYVVPAPGYVWAYHPRYGWGYRHPQYGWHRGWH